MSLKVKILFDNTSINKDLMPLWGFSALINIEGIKILFDTGSNGRILLRNAKLMGINFKELKYLFISHPHWDHTGGIDTVLEENSKLKLILPSSLSKHWTKDLKKFSAEINIINDCPKEIFRSVASTGIMAEEGEQSLILRTDKGLIIITGCGHPGIDNIIKRAKLIYNEKIYYIIGGFHLLHKTEKEILRIMENIPVRFITPTHCTGSLAIDMFKKYFENGFIAGGVGKEIEFGVKLK